MDSSYRHLAFLLSLGGVPLGCTGDDTSSGSDTNATTTTATTTNAPTTTATTGMSGTASEGGMTEATEATEATMATTASSATSETDPTATSSETTSTTGDGTVCQLFAEFYALCGGDPNSYDVVLAYCEDNLFFLISTFGQECADAAAKYYACIPSATCEEYDEGTACEEEELAIGDVCVPEIGATCEAYGAKIAECFGDTADEDVYCQQAIGYGEYYGEACGQAYEDYYVCLTELECADLDDDTGCEKAEDAIDELCI